MSKEVKTIKTVIAAQPGFDVVELCRKPYEFIYAPVVAWVVEVPDGYGRTAVTGGAGAFPVCADWHDNEDDASDRIIRRPDGSITFTGGPTFAKGQEDEALAYAVKHYEGRTGVREAGSR